MEKSACTCTNLCFVVDHWRLPFRHSVTPGCGDMFPQKWIKVIFLNKYLTLYPKVLPLLPLCKLILKKKGHRVRHEEQFIALYSGKAAENFIITLTNHGYSQRSHSHSREKTHNSFFFSSSSSLQLSDHMGCYMSWENCQGSWAHKIISHPLEECQVCIFFLPPEEPKSKLVYISGRQMVAISEFALMNYIIGLMQGADSSEQIFGS